MEIFYFHKPGPGGMTSGIDKVNSEAQWSEKRKEMMSQADTDEVQR